jgi:outer membrane protein assembly factor BamB
MWMGRCVVYRFAAAACALAATLVAGSIPSLALSKAGEHMGTGNSSAFDWAQFHQNPLLTGYAGNSPLSTSNVLKLGVVWAAELYGPALDSPVVAYDSALGKTLAYIGTENGDVVAVDVANGHIVWSAWLGSPIRATPLVSGGAVFAATFNSPRLYKLDASTGTIDCSVVSPQPIEGTPTAATPPGGVASVYIGTNDSHTAAGPLLAVDASDCNVEWEFTGYAQTAGSWTAAAYALDAHGEPLLVFGTSDPDTSVYAVDAVTGKEVWRFQAYNPSPGVYDVGAGVDISPPGTNGFAGGVAYVPTKLGVMYALNLTTGAQIWSTNFNQIERVTEGGRSTAALDGVNLVFGYNGGLIDLNAVSGTEIWSYQDPAKAEVLSSPAIAGATGQEIVAAGDLAGGVDVVSLAGGSQLYRYKTGNYITASPAVSDGNVLIASADGFLYDFALGGGNDAALPATTIMTPVDASTVANPKGSLTVTGTASDPTAVAGVDVAVQESGPDGSWWDAATGTWSSGPVGNAATLARPGASSTSWTFSYPVPSGGGTYQATAYAASSSGQSDIRGAHASFEVLHTTSGPHIQASPSFIPPGASAQVLGAGFNPSEQVTISLLGTTLATTTATAKGNLSSTAVKIPSNAAFGQTSLVATGETSGKSAAAAITIANSWEQLGDNATHTGYEPNDPVLYDLVHPGGDIFVDLAWHYQTGAAVQTSPAVANGVAYVANTAGALVAIDVHNGAPLWTWSLPSGDAIDGSPAVDPKQGLAFVAANDGTLDAVSTSTGHLVWSTTVGGDLAAPAYGNGEVYVTSRSGAVEAVAEATGARSWTVVLPSAVTAPAALDTPSNVLIVGESNGEVVSLNASSGVPNWTYATGGAVAAAATVSGGTVYVGSSDKNVYALSESTGAKLWSYTTGGAVSDTGALSSHGTPGGGLELLIGSGDGNLYALQPSNGSLNYKVAFKSPIVGVAAVKGVAVIDTASGLIGSSRTYVDLDVWNYQTGAGLTSAAIVDDGTIYVGAGDGNLYAFTSYGQPPS